MTQARASWALAAWMALLGSLSACSSTPDRSPAVPSFAERLRRGSLVTVEKNRDGHWVLLVDGAPYFVRGMVYQISKVGQSPEEGFRWVDWAYHDEDRNGLSDGPYGAWVDANRNNRQDEDETPVGDFQLLREMGANTIRWYHHASAGWIPNKHLLRDLYFTYGIRTAVGDFLGAKTIGSGASWEQGTDYRNPLQRQRMLESVKKMVAEHQDEPYLLLWLLGYENNWYRSRTNAAQYPEDYAKFVNEAAALIHHLDGRHPVALVNGDMGFLQEYARWTPEVDIFGANAFRGPDGFGVLWDGVRRVYDKPVLITEYGGVYASGADEEAQAAYHEGCWLDIVKHRAGGEGEGNSIGAFAAEWLDRWWAAGDPYRHAPIGSLNRLKPEQSEDSWETEHTGFCAQGDGRFSPFLRQLRKVYRVYQLELWVAGSPGS